MDSLEADLRRDHMLYMALLIVTARGQLYNMSALVLLTAGGRDQVGVKFEYVIAKQVSAIKTS